MRKVFAIFFTFLLFVTAIPMAYATTSFSDVPRSHWAYEAIYTMAEKGIINGYRDGTFRPNDKISRAEFAKIMIAAAGIDTDDRDNVKQTFTDVSRSHWAFYYVELAKSYLTGYKYGSTYKYKPDEDAVREDIAVALVRLMGYDRSKKADLDVLDRFRDEHRISYNLRPYIALAVQTNLMEGSNNGNFNPQNAITRAEAATLLYRAKLDESKVVFPDEPKPTPNNPEQPATITDSFSDTKLSKWNLDKQTGIWVATRDFVSAYSTDSDLDHYMLPLNWKEDSRKHVEMQVEVYPKESNGLGGLFFNGADGKADVVYVAKDAVYVSRVTDAKKKDMEEIAKISYNLQSKNTIKVVVKGNDVSVYVNGKFVYSQDNRDMNGTKLGLYLQREANVEAPKKYTYLDNFSFKVLP